MKPFDIEVMPQELSIYSFVNSDEVAICLLKNSDFICIFKTLDELSIVGETKTIGIGTKANHGWKALKVKGPLNFDLVGVLSSILQPLADAKISVFSISSFETDYILIKERALNEAISALHYVAEIKLAKPVNTQEC